jgi:predicted protein tyrosine phosphatase
MLRSPTIAWVLGQDPYGYNCRPAGYVQEYALVKVDDVLLTWADEVVCADLEHLYYVKDRLKDLDLDKPLVNLNLPDIYEYRDPELVKLIKERYDAYLNS